MIDIGIAEKQRKAVVEMLSVLLANEFVLYTKTLKAHWNVQCPFFHDVHGMFKEQYEELFIIVDDTAERIRALGMMAPATLQEYAQLTTIKEQPNKNGSVEFFVKQLLAGHETIIKDLRKNAALCLELGDEGSNDFCLELLRKHEKTAWMLRASLE